MEKNKTIDKSKPVLVTGATGYVAGWLIKKLLDEGLTVHAAIRDPGQKEKIRHLEELAETSKGSIRFFARPFGHRVVCPGHGRMRTGFSYRLTLHRSSR